MDQAGDWRLVWETDPASWRREDALEKLAALEKNQRILESIGVASLSLDKRIETIKRALEEA